MIPSKKQICNFLRLDDSQATTLRKRLEKFDTLRICTDKDIRAILDLASDLMGAFGVETVMEEIGTLGFTYVNVGETYKPTLLYDEDVKTFVLVWGYGYWIEAQEKKGRKFQ